ncbi:MAG: thioredoxin [bacterium]|nr:thioredoxin [bacterium]
MFKRKMDTRTNSLNQQGSTMIVVLMLVIIAVIALVAAGFHIFSIARMRQVHRDLQRNVSVQTKTAFDIYPSETQKNLTKNLTNMLDSMKVEYEPHHVQVQAELETNSIDVKIWYMQPYRILFIPYPQRFYIEATSRSSQGPPKEPVNATGLSFKRLVLESKLPVMVMFWTDWCEHCHHAMPTVEEIAHKYTGRIKVVKIDHDAWPDIGHKYSVSGTPQFLFFKKGSFVGEKSGYGDPQRLWDAVHRHLF